MPSEIRHLVFSTTEVVAAIREYRRHVGRPLPTGTLRRFEMHPGKGGVRASFDIVPDNTIPAQGWEVGSAEITDALILYCDAHHIPLPSTGIKTLQRFGDSLLFIVTVNLTGAGWPLSAGLAMHRLKPVEPADTADG